MTIRIIMNIKGWMQLRYKPSAVMATITFHRISCIGDLLVDWTNELGAGRKKVWRVNTKGESLQTKISEFGQEETFGNLRIGKTTQYQIFTEFFLELTSLTPSYQIEPPDPYNKL